MALGLTTDIAVRRLRYAIDDTARNFTSSCSNLLYFTFRHHFPMACCWLFLCISMAVSLAFICSPLFPVEANGPHEHIAASGAVLLFILCATVLFNLYFVYLRTTEIRRKVGRIVGELNEAISDFAVGLATPSLYEPASESITLQWAYRDGVLVNLPWILLVDGDVILLRPGREVPCKCRPVDVDVVVSNFDFEPGNIYMPQEAYRRMDGIGVDAFPPLLCRVEETPAITYVSDCLSSLERPRSVTENEYGRIVHFYVERIALPVVCIVAFAASVMLYIYNTSSGRRWYEILILTPAAIILPLTMPILSVYAWSFVILHTAQFLASFSDFALPEFKEGEKDAELFTEATTSQSSASVTGKGPMRWRVTCRFRLAWRKFRRVSPVVWRLLKGDPTNLPFSANVVQALGNVTSLSVVDKKGIMSWANPTPEKVFFFSRSRRKRASIHPGFLSPKTHADQPALSLQSIPEAVSENEQNCCSATEIENGSPRIKQRHLTVDQVGATPLRLSAGRAKPSIQSQKGHPSAGVSTTARAHAEVLDLSHDPNRSCVVHFDDPNWRSFSSNLKPLGLNILLNSCDLRADYVRFIDHVHAISAIVPRTIAVVNRRCLCYLAKAIGFDRFACHKHFDPQQTLAAYRRTPGELPVPGLTKHKSPLPNLFAVIVRDKLTGHCQLLCQGTADLVVDACDFYWDGEEVKPLDKQHRKKISDFSQRHNMTAYCVAFSYRPLAYDVDRSLSDVYIDWPLLSSRRQTDGSTESLFTADELRPWHRAISYDSLLSDEYFEVRKIDTPSEVLQHLLKRQVFLGMISLQYQAKPDVVRLVDRLDKACIRFVLYSKENELRSRIFAEKCGLEAGWNCHISLGRESEAISAAGSHLGSQVLARFGPSIAIPKSRTGMKWPLVAEISRRLSLPSDFKTDLPTVHFKSATATPINEAVPKVVTEDASSETKECKVGDDEEDEETEQDSSPKAPLAKGDRCPSVITISGDSIFDDPTDQQLLNAIRSERERTPLLSDATSRTSLATNHSLTQQPIVLPPNRARLPKGIENVRPHLENVDNVPLLVPLFTDCYPCATVDMVSIMQEYGEVVCVVGSSLNYRNAETFSQANASIGIEPLHPAVCMDEMELNQSDGMVSATDLAAMISSLPCSIRLTARGRINLLDLVVKARHLLTVLRTSWLFYLAASLTVSVVQLLAQLFTLPRPFAADALVWHVCVIIPLLSGSLCFTPQNADVLKTATAKNSNWVSKNAVKKFLIGFSLRFLPSAIFALLLFSCSLMVTCVDGAPISLDRCYNYSYSSGFIGLEPAAISVIGLSISRHLFSFTLVVYIFTISSGFVHYRALYKDNLPWTNCVWLVTVFFLLVVQFLYLCLRINEILRGVLAENDLAAVMKLVPWKVHLCGLLWPCVSAPLNELLKSYELERYRRDQRRRKLSFGTKLGMNSPF